MKLNDIKNLVEKFYEGETTEQEDLRLMEYFESEVVPEELYTEKYYFQSVAKMSEASLDDSFERRLMDKISEQPSKNSYRIWIYSLSGVAATIAIFFAIWLGNDVFYPTKVYGTIDDPNIAFLETRKVLEEVSTTMNKGLVPAKKTATKVESNVQRAGELKKMNNALDNVKKIRKIDDASDFLKSFSKVYVNYGNS